MQRVVGSAVAAFVVIAALSIPAFAQGSDIVPGQALGRFEIGQDLGAIITMLGPLHSEDDLPGGSFRGYYWPLKRIGVIVNMSTQKVAALAISYDDAYQTEKGVTAGAGKCASRPGYGGGGSR